MECAGKISHSTLGSAEIAAERLERKLGEAFNAYKCRECGLYHVGHTPFAPVEGVMATNSNYDPTAFEERTDDGQVQETQAPDISSLAVLNKSEIFQQIETARRFPRSIVQFRKEALQLVTLDETTAAECIYALPRGGKTIIGPSARFAEIINYSWGNTRAGARVVSVGEEFVTAQGLFYDLEKNTAISYEVQRRISDKNGRRYNADMIGVTSNAASSIGLRNAILKGIPKALWNPMYEAARKVVAGDVRTLANRRDEAIKAFAIFGIKPEQIFTVLGIQGIQDMTIDHLVVLKGLLTAIQDGDTTPEQAFARQDTSHVRAANGSQSTVDTLRDKYAKPASEGAGSTPNPPVGQDQGQPASEPGNPPRDPAPTSQTGETERPHGRRRAGREESSVPQGVPVDFSK